MALVLASAGSAQERPPDARAASPGGEGGIAYSIELTGTIDPATSAWVEQGLDEAGERGAALGIIRLDTPGGLDTAMRSIVQDILDAPLPVVVYVSPNGARAASAGLFVTLAGDVAAMAPQTNIGSATPITLSPGEEDEVLGRKIENDAAAYVRALAEAHGRNANLAEEMVREATNVTARTALEERLVDVVAPSEEALLAELDGFTVEGAKRQTLNTAALTVERRDMPLHFEIRQLLVNPTVAYLLLVGGLLAIGIEVFSPGLVGPGLFGAVAFILGLYGTAQLPVTAAGVVLIVLAVGLFLAETQVPSGGLLGGAGVVALVAAGLLLYDTDSDAFRVNAPVAVAVGALLGGFALFAGSKALAARRAPPRSGPDELVGEVGRVRTAIDPLGQVYVHGALWRARTTEGQPALPAGARVRVEGAEGLTLHVAPIDDDQADRPADDPPEHSEHGSGNPQRDTGSRGGAAASGERSHT